MLGGNYYGQLGDGTTTDRSRPVNVSGLTDVIAIAAGGAHTCGRTTPTTNRRVKCWGFNFYGQLGDGMWTNRPISNPTPGDVPGLSNVLQIAAGSGHTCARIIGGGVKCWGFNISGQLGNGTWGTNFPIPVDVSGLISGVLDIAAGGLHTCALIASGGVKCWGSNVYGQLGNGTRTNSPNPTPVDVSGLSNVLTIAAGFYHTCALITGDRVKCWGNNVYGQLGDGTTTDRNSPVDVSGLSNVLTIAAGFYHTCALITGDRVKCWGNNVYGQLGDGTTTHRYTPVSVVNLTRAYLPLVKRSS
ncbi:MAG: hypothetical protein RML99_08790 [Anaerolineae bacterium]|nr:hypothetical protein [Anaerolineae bacterium]